ncbi:FAD-dependent oxidoreductase [Micromonospora sp. CA-263727]|uniref:FAD-dependent oxidoreductase n=1 Tax=Micromonospora sp. CA-263727 TaxID=3239967 RepID=UPI003D89B6E0
MATRAADLDAEVLVVGAGIAGLWTAFGLQRAGIEVRVVERATELRTTGAGIVLHPNALAHLAPLAPALAEHGAMIERQVTTDVHDGSSRTVDWRSVWQSERAPVAIYRRRLADLMLAGLRPDTVVWSTTPERLEQNDHVVTMRFADGRTGRYHLVIGADGAYSWTRRMVDPATSPRYLGQTYWRTTAVAEGVLRVPEWQVWRSGSHFFGVTPLGGGRVHVFVQATRPRQVEIASGAAERQMVQLASSLGPHIGDLVRTMRRLDGVQVHPALTHLVKRWSAGRIGLVGDAAHSLSPATTQGGALAVEDAAVLVDEITRNGAGPKALTAFEARRQQRVAMFFRLARLHTTLMQSVGVDRPAGSSPDGDSVRWFRRLYGPLMKPA